MISEASHSRVNPANNYLPSYDTLRWAIGSQFMYMPRHAVFLAILFVSLSAAAQISVTAPPLLPPPTPEQVKAAAAMPFSNPTLPLEQRVDDLVSRLTLEEKVSQLIDRAVAI